MNHPNLTGSGDDQGETEEDDDNIEWVEYGVGAHVFAEDENDKTSDDDEEDASHDALTNTDHLELGSQGVNEVVPATVHPIVDENDIENHDKEAQGDVENRKGEKNRDNFACSLFIFV